MGSPRTSVIVPTFNRAALLSRTLESLCSQTDHAAPFEVIVSDDGSDDETAAIAKTFGPRLDLQYVYARDSGHRVAAARNAAARAASGTRYAFLDSGTIAAPEFISGHELLDDDSANSTAIIGRTLGYGATRLRPEVIGASGDRSASPMIDWRYAKEALRDVRETFTPLRPGPIGVHAPWRLCWSCNMSLDAAAFWADAGGFDNGYVGWGLEDTDFAYRMHLAGVRFAWSERALALEHPHERGASSLRDAERNVEYFLSKPIGSDAELYVWARRHSIDVTAAFERLIAWSAQLPGEYRNDADRSVSPVSSWRPAAATRLYLGSTPPGSDWVRVYPFDEAATFPDDNAAGVARIGMYLPFPDKAFDLAMVSAEYRPVWSEWGTAIANELNRVARNVTFEFETSAP